MRLVLGGHEAVILFFVLSGFVLTIQITGRKPFSYAAYAAQRFLRIYPPYLCAFLAAFVCYKLTASHPTSWAGNWFNGAWRPHLPADAIWGHLALILPFHTASLVPVFWTLVYEMRISLILPVLVSLADRVALPVTLLAAAALSFIASMFVSPHYSEFIISSVSGQWAPTLHYAAIFLLGIVLARHRESIASTIERNGYALLVLLGGIVFFFSGSLIGLKLRSLYGDLLYDWAVAIGSVLMIAAVISDARINQRLSTPVLTYLGDISYSLYLLHATVLLTVVHLLGNTVPHALALLIAFALTLPIADLSHRCIELPTIRLGRSVAKKIREATGGSRVQV